MTQTERAINNELNCQAGAGQLLYSLAELGILKEDFGNYAAGFPIPKDENHPDHIKWKQVIQDLSDSILMFHDEIVSHGEILGSLDKDCMLKRKQKSNETPNG